MMRKVFIGGCGRSGTTFLASMLGVPADHIATPESQFKTDVLVQQEHASEDFSAVIEFIQESFRFRIWGLDDIKEEIGQLSPSSYDDLMESLVQIYAERTRGTRPSVWIDHTPINIWHTGKIASTFSNSVFINLLRDGRAVAASMMKTDWGIKHVTQATRRWVAGVAAGLASEQQFPERVMRVRYEDLVTDTERTLRGICDFCRIDYSPEMLKANGIELPDYTRAQHANIGHGVSDAGVTKWQVDLSPREIELFELETGDLLQLLGYDRFVTGPIAPLGLKDKMDYLVKSTLVKLADAPGRFFRRSRI